MKTLAGSSILALLAGTSAAAQPAEPTIDAPRLVENLHDDDVYANALHARQTLWSHAEEAREPLLKALDSSDWQQRQYAFLLLAMDKACPPNDAMVRVAIEALRDDRMGSHVAREAGEPNEIWDNAYAATRYLIRVGVRSETQLASALNGDDAQQRFLVAYCLGMMGSTVDVEGCSAELLPHLRDNDIDFDAVMATPALYRLGPTVIPYLLRARPLADRQQGEMIDLIILDLTNPPRTADELAARKPMQSITTNKHDPAIEVHIQQMFHMPYR